MASSSKSPFKLSIDPKFAEKVGIGALQCVACLGFFFAVRVTIASRTSAVCGFLPARALAPVLEQQALDDTIHVGLLPAPNRRLRHPNLALDGIRPEAATRQQYNACVCDDLRVIRLCEVLLHGGTHGSIQVRRQKHQIFGSIDTERARRNRARRPRTPGSTA